MFVRTAQPWNLSALLWLPYTNPMRHAALASSFTQFLLLLHKFIPLVLAQQADMTYSYKEPNKAEGELRG